MYVIFDLDQTIIDSDIAYETRKNGNWKNVYALIPSMKPYNEIVRLINALLSAEVKVAVVTSSPKTYCTKVLDSLDIKDVITVCYHDTEKHKPDPEPILLAIEKMGSQKYDNIIVIGDEDNDTIAANQARRYYKNIKSVLGGWGHNDRNIETIPTIFCRDEQSLLKYFSAIGLNLGESGLREREGKDNVYQLFDYYPFSKKHDMLSEAIFYEVKEKNNSTTICEAFYKAFIKQFNNIQSNTYGIFVVPSSTAGKWNTKLTDYVVPQLVNSLGLIDCSKYILRHTTRAKQAHGGDRSVSGTLSTIKLQYELPSQMIGAFIIDDITTTGNIFEACTQVICQSGQINEENINCIAIGGTVSFDNIYSFPEPEPIIPNEPVPFMNISDIIEEELPFKM